MILAVNVPSATLFIFRKGDFMKMNRWLASLAAGSVFLYIFKTVYNYFGHGVTSSALDSAWYWPLFLLVFLLVLGMVKPAMIKTAPMRASFRCYLLAVISVVIGRVLTGIFEIAGTSSGYVLVYYIAALVCILIGSFYLAAAMKMQNLRQLNS